MKLIINFIILSMVILQGCSQKVLVQWPNPVELSESRRIEGKNSIGTYRNPYMVEGQTRPIAPGIIFLKNGSQLKGKIWLQPNYSTGRAMVYQPQAQIIFKPWSEINKKNLDSFWVKKYIKEIDSIKMAIPLPDGIGDTTLFVNRTNKWFFWRLLMRNSDVKIFDINLFCDEYKSTGDIAIVKQKSEIVLKTYGGEDTKRKVQNYISKKYGENVNSSSTITDMLKYILNQEAELQDKKY